MECSGLGMRWTLRGAGWVAVCTVTLVGPDAHAQSLLQNLFGFASGPQKPTVYRSSPRNSHATWQSDYDIRESQISPARYRTMCVRMCDGYYFPISSSTMRGAFHRDAAKCKSSCGDDSRLFYMPASDPDPERMVDLTGRSYAALPTAYVYRKRLIDGCSCRPMPWSSSERLRHLRYRYEAEMAKIQETRPLTLAKVQLEPSEPSITESEKSEETITADAGSEMEAEASPLQNTRTAANPIVSRGQPKHSPRRPSNRDYKRNPSKPASGQFNGWGSGTSAYTWPGDAPRSYR